MSFANLCSSRWKFCGAQLSFKRTRTCQFCRQGWRNIPFLWWLLAKNWFVSCSQFLLADHTGSGSCTFAHFSTLKLFFETYIMNATRPAKMLPPNTTDNKSIAISIVVPCVVYINADKQSIFLLDYLSNTIQNNFNHSIADHNFIVI